MKISGRLTCDGTKWFISIPALAIEEDAFTIEEVRMKALDRVVLAADDKGIPKSQLHVSIDADDMFSDQILVSAEDPRRLVQLMLHQLRMEENLTQAEVAQRMGSTVNAYRQYENGQRMPTLEMLDRILRALNEGMSLTIGVTRRAAS